LNKSGYENNCVLIETEDNKTFIETIIDSTNYSRYTINTRHSFVRYNEGWGGISPTGFKGE